LHAARKQTVFAMVERAGNVHAQVVPDSRRQTLRPRIRERVVPGTVVYTTPRAAFTAPTMPLLARAKRKVGRALNSWATASEAGQNQICAYLSGALRKRASP
jgi:hypothetical protein